MAGGRVTSNVYILPGVPALFRRKFVDIRDRFRTEPVTIARVYLDADEGAIADDLDAVVAAHPAVKIGSYPRFSEQDFKVLVTLEGRDAADVERAFAMLVERARRGASCRPRLRPSAGGVTVIRTRAPMPVQPRTPPGVLELLPRAADRVPAHARHDPPRLRAVRLPAGRDAGRSSSPTCC